VPDDSTRKLLKVFGVSVTECEDAVAALTVALRDPATVPSGPGAAIEAYGKAARDLAQRCADVGRLILDYQLRAHDAIAAYVKEQGPGTPRPVQ
jgi:hypothetical protein